MTFLTRNDAAHAAGHGGLVAPLARWVAKTWTAMRRRQELDRAIRELQALDDHMLADIGLDRSEIERAALFGRTDRGGY
jgi:uncharacterized protein YjiS (DUF1127 family)